MHNKVKRKLIMWPIIIILIVIISNSWLFKTITGIDNNYYRYSNISGLATFNEYPEDRIYTNRSILPGSNKDWSLYKQNFPNNSTDTVYYRLYKKNIFKFWRWEEYLFNWRYQLPYKNWEEIKTRRGEHYIRNKRFQAF